MWGDDRGRGARRSAALRSNTAPGCGAGAYLVQQQFVPYARVREVLADVFGAALSVGTLVNLVRQGAERLEGVEQEIKARCGRRRCCIMTRRGCAWWERRARGWSGRT